MMYSLNMRRPRGPSVISAIALSLMAAGCIPQSENESENENEARMPPQQLAEAVAVVHEPVISIFRGQFKAFAAKRFVLTEVDRDFRLSFGRWSNGTSYPSMFRFTATSPSGLVTQGELSDNPILDVTPLPGESTLTIDIEHQSVASGLQANIQLTSQIKPAELGVCGDQIRDLFVRWVYRQLSCASNPWCLYASETPPRLLSFTWALGMGTSDYRLRGVLQGTHGPILQIEERSNGFLVLNALLFFDGQGQLLRKVDGQYYFTLPNGNLLVSTGMTNAGSPSTPWAGVFEAVKAVNLSGETLWHRFIGGTPPGRVVVTAAGNLVMPWAIADSNARGAGIHTFDPDTATDTAETFVDRAELCAEASTEVRCQDGRAQALAHFQDWWSATWLRLLPSGSLREPRKACGPLSCYTTSLVGWQKLGAEYVLEVRLDYADANNGGEYRNILVFVDDNGRRELGGKILRRLGDNRLLVSLGAAKSAYFSSGQGAWYATQETLAAVGNGAVVAWSRAVGGRPTLVDTSVPRTSNGYLLPNHQLFWTAWQNNGTYTTQQVWVDLDSGAALPVPGRRILEGVCVP